MNPGATALTVTPRLINSLLKRPSQPNHPRFTGGIVGLSRIANQSRDAGHVDDPAVFRSTHDAGSGARADKTTGQVGCDHVIPFLVRHASHQFVARDPGVVDQDIKPTVFLLGTIRSQLWLQHDRSRRRQRLPPFPRPLQSAHCIGQFVGIACQTHHGRPVCRQCYGNGFTKALRGTSNNGNLVSQVSGQGHGSS